MFVCLFVCFLFIVYCCSLNTLFILQLPRVFFVGDLFVGVPKYTSSLGVYFHSGREVVFSSLGSGGATVLPTVVEKAFWFAWGNLSIANHSLTKYR